MPHRVASLLVTIGLLSAGLPRAPAAAPDDTAAALAALRQVGPDAAGHRQAQAAWQKISQADAGQLPQLLAGLDDAGPLAANWIRAAIDTVAERQARAGGQLPVAGLESFLSERSHAPRARRLAFELLVGADPAAADRWTPRLLDDPSLELRREAVARLLDEARALSTAKDIAAAQAAYERALNSARDLDQVKAAAEALKPFGVTADLARQLGFVTRWQVIGPFDNLGGKGFAAVYPPEKQVDLQAALEGPAGPLRWTTAESSDEFGNLDLNRALGTKKGVVAYAYAEFVSGRRQAVELRLGTLNAHKMWLNDRPLSEAEVYHSFTNMDQYIGRGTLEPGTNRILLKICQNEQTQDWAVDWKFQLRVCDPAGNPLHSEEAP